MKQLNVTFIKSRLFARKLKRSGHQRLSRKLLPINYSTLGIGH